MNKLLATVAAAFAVSGACSAGQELAGTSWQLLAIQSMDDAQGTAKVNEPSHFTLEFGRDGRAALRLDCNRGMGDYQFAPAGDGSSGALTFGPIAATRALCPPPHLDERIARDMAQVRSYLLKDGKLYLSLLADGGIYEWAPLRAAADGADKDRVVKPVKFDKGRRSTVIRDRIVGRQTIDYQLLAGAGQRMTVRLKGRNGANYFNLLPPDSPDAAMTIGEQVDNHYDGVLPDDGLYTIRVFLMRSAGRRNEAGDFTLSIGINGSPLKPVPASVDAVLPGTRYHARATTKCEPLYSKARECEALVVRRGVDGTATVELRWDSERKRRILFVKGEPKAADSAQALTFTRNERGWRVSFNGEEHFEIPEALVYADLCARWTRRLLLTQAFARDSEWIVEQHRYHDGRAFS
jgi:heat shock protein HslJ